MSEHKARGMLNSADDSDAQAESLETALKQRRQKLAEDKIHTTPEDQNVDRLDQSV